MSSLRFRIRRAYARERAKGSSCVWQVWFCKRWWYEAYNYAASAATAGWRVRLVEVMG